MKAIVPLADGFEEIEAITIIDVLRRGGVEVMSVAIDDSGIDVEGAHGIGIVADEEWDDEFTAEADALVLPGGLQGMKALKADERVLAAVRNMNAAGKFVCAICAAPVVLHEAGVLAGRKFTCYPGMESEIKGGAHKAGERVVRDGNIITGNGPAGAMEFALAVLAAIAGEDKAAAIANGMGFAK